MSSFAPAMILQTAEDVEVAKKHGTSIGRRSYFGNEVASSGVCNIHYFATWNYCKHPAVERCCASSNT